MRYERTIVLKDGRACILRSGTAADGRAALDSFILTHAQTDWLLTYPDENDMTPEAEGRFLQEKADSADEIELLALIGDRVVGSAGFGRVGAKDKVKHRADFGVGVEREYWGLGVGRTLTEACIECARRAGYAQLELEVVAENARAIALYESLGFVEYGRNPRGFRSRESGWQALSLMRLELDGERTEENDEEVV